MTDPSGRRIVAFLLDELPAPDREQIEDGFRDDASFQEAMAVEEELFDAYAAGTLSGEYRRRFERKFLATPAQRRKLRFSRAFLKYRRHRSWFPKLSLMPKLVWALAGLMLLAAPAWWLSHRQSRSPGQPMASHPVTAPAPVLAVFVLAPGQTRDLGASQPFTAPLGATLIEFDAILEVDAYSTYRASLRTIEGAEIWNATGLRSVAVPAGRAVQASVPANLLASRDYILTIDGIPATGEPSIAAEYSFTFAR